MKVYVAAPYAEAKRAQAFANELSVFGPEYIVSTWHRDALPVDSTDDSVLAAGMWQDITELERAEVVVALTSRGSPRATFSEIGWALARGKVVVWVHGPAREGTNIFAQHGLVRRVVDHGDETALLNQVLKALLSVQGIAA